MFNGRDYSLLTKLDKVFQHLTSQGSEYGFRVELHPEDRILPMLYRHDLAVLVSLNLDTLITQFVKFADMLLNRRVYLPKSVSFVICNRRFSFVSR